MVKLATQNVDYFKVSGIEFNLEKQQLETERRQSELLLKAQARQNSTIALSVGALGLLGLQAWMLSPEAGHA